MNILTNIGILAGQLAQKGKADKVTVDRLAKLHPKNRADAYHIYMDIIVPALNGKAFCRFDTVFRSFAEQQNLYKLGRTVVNPDGKSAKKPMGNVVTNAQAGQSFHCYGLAIDYYLVTDRDGDGNYTKAEWDMLHDFDGDGIADWTEVEKAFCNAGWEWGGNWKSFKDYPHVQKTYGYHWSDLLKLHNAGKVDAQGYVLI